MLRDLNASVAAFRASIAHNKYDEYSYAGLAVVLLQFPCVSSYSGRETQPEAQECMSPVKELLDDVLNLFDELHDDNSVEFLVTRNGEVEYRLDHVIPEQDEIFTALTANERPAVKSMLHFAVFQLANALANTSLGKCD